MEELETEIIWFCASTSRLRFPVSPTMASIAWSTSCTALVWLPEVESIWEMAEEVVFTEELMVCETEAREEDMSDTEEADLNIFPTSIRMFWEKPSNPRASDSASWMLCFLKREVKFPWENSSQWASISEKVPLMRRLSSRATTQTARISEPRTMVVLLRMRVLRVRDAHNREHFRRSGSS